MERLEQAIENHLRPCVEATDPVTKQPFALVEGISEAEVSWGKRISLFNGHYLDYLIREDGELVEQTSV